ncbi:hypothetical protein B0O99DRAFT_693169 [Bisporella sp. PMI_857]|nr:hypothetical protein B0O99DRAFT_693169 [Bisporella sp. PMI_857]
MSEKYEYLFIFQDLPTGAENRNFTTDPHEDFVREVKEFWLGGGPIFKNHQGRSEPQQFHGSWVLLHATSEDEARELLLRDPFTTGKVWDWEKAQVFNVQSGLRVALENSRFGR